ncbi:MAG TPA: BsuBI/PstI family type II restriction endonuclease [Catalimonadaceae bacterium]|nr:BsuBI/PstI family type II restriction endonuclease [Catalimonadaceae bacterium]HPI09515.1 BsuBI/PstI family type II restriction endonuclease [Catalimonadaceae bacterium]
MKNYIPKSVKSRKVKKLINEALHILESVGIPIEKTERGLERMAICFLAVAGIEEDWNQSRLDTNLKTRGIINFINLHFGEKISPGSYDDIKRKDLKLLLLADLILNSGETKGSATNDPTRGYSLQPDFWKLLTTFKTDAWGQSLINFKENRPSLAEILSRKRSLDKIPVKLPGGKMIELSIGKHNDLQKSLIEEFLPRFGSDCTLLYVGDTAKKSLHIDKDALQKLNFFELSHDELPDIIAFSENKNWLYLIEAVHSTGPMSEVRVLELKRLLKDCKAELIFVTGFLTRSDFKKWMMDVAWETEVWIADNPDHLVHFNGHKFLGAY